MSQLIASAGPFQGMVYDNNAVYQDWQKYAYLGQNGYFLNSSGAKSWQTRPGFTRYGPIVVAGTARTQGAVSFVDPTTGTIYRFFAVGGKLYRADADYVNYTDVTPLGVTINASAVNVSFTPMGTSCVVTDGVNRPWVMTNFGGTPVTGTYISIDGTASTWTTWGRPTVYQGSVFFIALTVPGGSAVLPRVGIVWSEPNQPTVGYTQTGYANYWNIIENGTEPLTAILGTNNGLFYWRESSIGIAAGTPSISFSTTATKDARSDSVGSVSPWAVAQVNGNIFFLDNRGRAWKMALDGEPEPIWQQAIEANAGYGETYPTFLGVYAKGVAVPEINQYLVAAHISDVAGVSPDCGYVFDGATGGFAGIWTVGASSFYGASFDTLEPMLDANGRRVLCLAGSGDGTGASGSYVRILNSINGGPWADNGGTDATRALYTKRLGYNADRVLYPDTATAIVQSSQTMASVVISTSDGAQVTLSSVAPNANAVTGENRAVMGLSGTVTRWVSLVLTCGANPTLQWGVQRIDVFGSTGLAGPEDG